MVKIKILNPVQLNKIHELGLKLIEEVGIKVTNEKVLKKLSNWNEIKIEKNRVKIKSDFVNNEIEKYKNNPESKRIWWLVEQEMEPQEDLILRAATHSMSILDIENDTVRQLTTDDLIQTTKLIDTLYDKKVRGAAPGIPCDVHPLLQSIVRYKISCEYSRCGSLVNPVDAIISAEYIYRMCEIMEKPFVTGMFMMNPLRMEGNDFDKILHFIGRKNVYFCINTWPMIGATGPLSFTGIFVQAVAEVLGGYVILKLISDNNQITFNVNARGFDMKYGNIIYGSPEDNLSYIISNQINEFYNNPLMATFASVAKELSVQSGVERTSSVIAGFLSGGEILLDGGLLCHEVFSAEQLIYDIEIMEYAKRILREYPVKDDFCYDVIKEISLLEGDYLSHSHTLENHRNFYWIPEIFDYTTIQQWQIKKEKTKDKVKTLIKEKIKSHNFELDKKKREELDKIYQSACNEIMR